MKKETSSKPAAKKEAKAAPQKLKDLQPKKDAKGGWWHPPTMQPPTGNHNETLVCG